MKRFNIKITALALALGALSLAGCKKFLDINENPNSPSDADVTLLLPTAQAAIGHVVGSPFQIYGSIWSQYWTQSISASQYAAIDQYSPNASNFDRPWRMIYTNSLQNLNVIISKAGADQQLKQYAAIAYILKGYTFQLATDAFGDIPVTEANNVDITNPFYDPQQVVYDSVFTLINKGLDLLDANAAVKPGSEDLLFAGDMEQWRRFAYTLKLRAFLRLSEIQPTRSRDSVATLAGKQFLTQDAEIQYSSTGGNQNPLFAEILGLGRTQNLAASATVVNAMKALNDPRVNVFYQAATETSPEVIGLPQGSYDSVPAGTIYSIPTAVVGAKGVDDQSALAPVKFISAEESYFLQAEAAARGWIAGGNAQALYQQGITASFTSYDIAPGNYITTVVGQFPGTQAGQIQAIITQKYFAMCGNQGFEAWTEYRRTGFPSFFRISAATALGDGEMPERLLYPNTEVTQNANFPGLQLVTTRVWWDKN